MASKIHVAYLAGLIDGEGYIALLPSRVKGLKNASFEPVVKIGMTGESALNIFQVLQIEYGGHINKRSGLTKGNREAWTWNLKSRKKVTCLLMEILPYLIIKKPQAELLVQFCELGVTHSNHKSFRLEIVEEKVRMYNTLKALKLPEPLATTN